MILVSVLLLFFSFYLTVIVLKINKNYINQIVLLLFIVNFFLGHVLLLAYRLLTHATNPLLLGDRRLVDSSLNLGFIFFLNILEFVCIEIGYLITQIFWKGKFHSILALPDSLNRALIGLSLAGWIGNVAILSGRNNLFSAFHPFEILGTFWIVSGFRLKGMHISYPIIFGISHFMWAIFFYHSKSETFVVLVALLIRLLHSNSQRRKLKILSLIVLTVLLFPFIQIQKGIYTVKTVQSFLSQTGSSNSVVKSLFIGILQRFDGADSITDAYVAGGGIWYNLYDYCKILLSKFIPNVSFLVGDYFGENSEKSMSMGQLWNDQMRPHSLSNVTLTVPVTYTPMAEGYAISGIALGILLSMSFGILISKLCNMNYSNNLFSIALGMSFICHLELLQNSTITLILWFQKAIQCWLLLFIFKIILTSKRNLQK